MFCKCHCSHDRNCAGAAQALVLVGDTDGALAYTSDDAMKMYVTHGAHLSGTRQRGQALAATGDGAAAVACLEKAAADAAEVGMFMHELQAVLALVTCGLGGAEAARRLGSLVGKLEGSPEQVEALLQTRDGAPAVDLGELKRNYGLVS